MKKFLRPPIVRTSQALRVIVLGSLTLGLTSCPSVEGGETPGAGPGATVGAPQKLNDVSYADMRVEEAVFDDAGNGLALWRAYSGTGAKMLWSYLDASTGSWSPDAVLLDDWGDYFSVATDGSSFLVVWLEHIPGSGYRVHSKLHDGLGWSDELTHSYAEMHSSYPMVVSNGSEYLITWNEYYDGALSVCGQRFDGIGWEPAILLETSDQSCQIPQSAAAGSGFAVVWRQPAGSSYEHHANVFDGQSWRGEAMVGDAASPSDWIQIVGNAGGYAAGWIRNDEERDLIGAIYDHDTGAWSSPPTVASGDEPVSSFELCADDTGFMWAWIKYDTAYNGNLFARRYQPVLGWQPEQALESWDESASALSVTSNGDGFVAAWNQYDSTVARNMIFVAEYSNDSWWPPVSVSSQDGWPNSPRIVSNGDGYAVSWSQSDGLIQSAYSSVFTGSSWSLPTQLSSGDSNATAIQIEPAGADYVIHWEQNDDQNLPSLFARRFASFWEPEIELVTSLNRGGCMMPQMAINDEGDVLSVWLQYAEGRNRLFASFCDQGQWGAPFLVDNSNNLWIWMTPRVASNGDNFLIAWVSSGVIHTRSCSADGTLESAVEHPGTANDLDLAANSTGYALAWIDTNVFYARTFDGGSWNEDVAMAAGGTYASNARITSNGTGYAVSWLQQELDDPSRVYANLHDGSSWGTPAAIDSSGEYCYAPRIASNGLGYAATWRRFDPDTNQYRTYVGVYDGSQWEAEMPLGSPDRQSIDPWITSDSSGYAVAWSEQEWYSDQRRVLVSLLADGSWSAPETLDIGTDELDEVRVTRDGSGYAVLWCRGEGDDERLYLRRFREGSWAAETLLDGEPGEIFETCTAEGLSGFYAGWCRFDADGDPAASDLWTSAVN